MQPQASANSSPPSTHPLWSELWAFAKERDYLLVPLEQKELVAKEIAVKLGEGKFGISRHMTQRLIELVAHHADTEPGETVLPIRLPSAKLPKVPECLRRTHLNLYSVNYWARTMLTAISIALATRWAIRKEHPEVYHLMIENLAEETGADHSGAVPHPILLLRAYNLLRKAHGLSELPETFKGLEESHGKEILAATKEYRQIIERIFKDNEFGMAGIVAANLWLETAASEMLTWNMKVFNRFMTMAPTQPSSTELSSAMRYFDEHIAPGTRDEGEHNVEEHHALLAKMALANLIEKAKTPRERKDLIDQSQSAVDLISATQDRLWSTLAQAISEPVTSIVHQGTTVQKRAPHKEYLTEPGQLNLRSA